MRRLHRRIGVSPSGIRLASLLAARRVPSRSGEADGGTEKGDDVIVYGGLRAHSIRLGPGEDVLARLLGEFDRHGAAGACVAAAIGSLSQVTYAVAVPSRETIATYSEYRREEGTIEVGSLQGHLGRHDDGRPDLHLHGIFVSADGRVVGGHVFGARVLLTLEITLLVSSHLAWRVRPLALSDGTEPSERLRMFVPELVDEQS